MPFKNAYTVPGNIFQISLNQIWIHNKIKTTDLHWKEQLGPVLQQMCGSTARPPAKPCNGEREQKLFSFYFCDLFLIIKAVKHVS